VLENRHDDAVDDALQHCAEDAAHIDLDDHFGDGPEDIEDLLERVEVHVAEFDEPLEEVIEREVRHTHRDEGAAEFMEDDGDEGAAA